MEPWTETPSIGEKDVPSEKDVGFKVIQRRFWGAKDPKRPPPYLTKPVLYIIYAYSRRDIMSGGKLRLGTIPEKFMKPRPKTLAPLKGSSDIDYIEAMQRLQQTDMRRSVDIRYNFVIDPEGRIYKGRGWSYVPYLPSRLNILTQQSIYIGYMSTLFEDPPSTDVLALKNKIIDYGIHNNFISKKFVELHLRHVFNKPLIDDIIALP